MVGIDPYLNELRYGDATAVYQSSKTTFIGGGGGYHELII